MGVFYKTVSKESQFQHKVKGSSFIAFLFPITDETQFKKRLTELKKEFHDATHHCFAYRLNQDGDLFRSSDDGEPSGTAGKPMLNQMIAADLTNTAMIIVRYFGGTKLGTGGLLKAYKEAAKMVIESAEIIEVEICVHYRISFPFEKSTEVDRILKKFKVKTMKKEADAVLHLTIAIPLDKSEDCLKNLKQIGAEITLSPQ